MQKTESQHNHVQNQPAVRQGKGATLESPQGEQIAQLEAMAESSPQVAKQAQLAVMVDSSPAMAAQRKLIGQVHNSPALAAQRQAFNGIAQRAETPAKSNNSGLPDNLKSGIESLSGMAMDNVKIHYNSSQPVQLVPSHSATFAPSPASAPLITALDAQIPAADAQAQAELANPPTGTHTPHQAVYINNPTPMNWGYCVEEQLDPLATASGWTRQVILSNSRPDYGRVIAPNTHLFVDLTSVAQAGVGGNHITGKLNASNRPVGDIWEGSDITHNGPPGGPAPVLRTNGPVSPLHMRRFQAFKRHCNRPDSGFHPSKDNVRRRYRGVTHATFTQVWTKAQRTNFSRLAKAAGF